MSDFFDDDIEVENIEVENIEELEQLEYYESEDQPIFKTVNVTKKDFSIFELYRKWKNGKIIYDVDFQRNQVWENKQKYELIESILMGLPLPIFYFKQADNAAYIVVDGKQRLSTLFSFFNNEFALKKLRILSEINGKKFKDLEGKYSIYQSQLEDYQVYSHVILPPTPDRILFDIFDRVNRGGTQLNKQEIRNALYHGRALDTIDKVVKSDIFITATGLKPDNDKRMKASYLMTRYWAFNLYFTNALKSGNQMYQYRDIDDLLEFSLIFLNKRPDSYLQEMHEMSIECLGMAYDLIGKGAFRKNLAESNPINMNIFETTMYLMDKVRCDARYKEGIREKLMRVISSDEFLSCIGDSRDGYNKVCSRFKLMDAIIEEMGG